MGSRNEYTGETPRDLVGKRRFKCDCCRKKYPITLLDWHHVQPRAGGGSDDPNNFARLCSGCHQFLHRIAKRLLSTKSGKSSTLVLVRDYANSLFEDDHDRADVVVQNVLKYAVEVASWLSEKSSKGLVGDTDVIIKDIPPDIKRLLIKVGKIFKNNSNKSVGVSGIALYATLTFVESMIPEESLSIRTFLAARGFGSAEPKPVETNATFKLKVRT